MGRRRSSLQPSARLKVPWPWSWNRADCPNCFLTTGCLLQLEHCLELELCPPTRESRPERESLKETDMRRIRVECQ
eukprot:Skav220480  [mRNA]  locus=scaffold591:73340:73992:+ [translate_table: standard]